MWKLIRIVQEKCGKQAKVFNVATNALLCWGKIVGQKGSWMREWGRRAAYVTVYELIAIICTTGLLVVLGHQGGTSTSASVVVSVIAVTWNLVWNTCFEWWEKRQSVKGRSLRRRVVHAIGFEGGLVLYTLPFLAWWLDITLWQAFLLDAGLLVFFLIYSFVFAWCFDRLFGLPASALPDLTQDGDPSA